MLHERHKIPGVAESGVLSPLLLKDGHGHLGEIVHHEVFDLSPGDLIVWRGQKIPPEPLSTGDPDPFFHQMILM